MGMLPVDTLLGAGTLLIALLGVWGSISSRIAKLEVLMVQYQGTLRDHHDENRARLERLEQRLGEVENTCAAAGHFRPGE